MNAGKWIGIGILITVCAVMAAFALGWFLWGNGFWFTPEVLKWEETISSNRFTSCAASNPPVKRDIIPAPEEDIQCKIAFSELSDDRTAALIADECTRGANRKQIVCPAEMVLPQDGTDTTSISWCSVYAILKQYLVDIGLPGLAISEVIEFEDNYYALISEMDTGIGAMELLVDKKNGIVISEIGPNMMWNTKYGMHGRGMIIQMNNQMNALSEKAVLAMAQEWLSSHLPDIYIGEHADRFYGYYTLHTVRNGQIQGMLSVHGKTGQVWYHNWHGAFVRVLDYETVQ